MGAPVVLRRENSMLISDYSAPAEVYATPARGGKRTMFYRKFTSLAEAVRFIVEDLPKGMLHPLAETDRARFEGGALRALYDADDFPLPRAARPQPRATEQALQRAEPLGKESDR
jgi:hypothetical protein